VDLDVTVCIGTFGGAEWPGLAAARAIPSIPTGVPWVHAHGRSLAEARNMAARGAGSEWICFVDADDQLSDGYFDAMSRGSADLRGPACRYAREHPSSRPAKVWPQGDLYDMNFLVIGTLVRREMFFEAGGFGDEPVYEDYALWCRCAKLGASIEIVPDAVYLAWVRRDSRNRAPDMRWKNEWHMKIRDAVWPERAAA
jgi:glycosyltransferase involved in cell wall biosynthesis